MSHPSAAAPVAAAAPSRLRDFPVSFFSTVMGLAGFSIVVHRVEGPIGAPPGLAIGLLLATMALFVTLAAIYLAKLITHPDAVRGEWRHPVRISFFPTMSIGLILTGTAAQMLDTGLAAGLWAVGALLHLGFTLAVMTAWITQTQYEVAHSNPAWFIPVVGNILVPVAGVRFAPADVSWFFFAVGLVFWLVLMTIIVYRLIFHPPLPGKLVPTLVILLAPPSVGFLAWVAIAGEVDAFARLLYFFALFVALLLTIQLPAFFRLRFALSWWAYSFPLAAFTLATLTMGEKTATAAYLWAGVGLAGLLALVIGLLVGRTVLAVTRAEICLPEH